MSCVNEKTCLPLQDPLLHLLCECVPCMCWGSNQVKRDAGVVIGKVWSSALNRIDHRAEQLL